MCVGWLQAPAPAEASADQLALFQSQHLLADPADGLASLRTLGVSTVRAQVQWQALAPDSASRVRPRGFDASDPAAYSTEKLRPYDELVRLAQADGIGIELLLGGHAPRWATGSGPPPGGPYLNWKPSAHEYGLFVEAMARRYGGSFRPPGSSSPLPAVRVWELWNEPNFGQELAPQALHGSSVAPRLYRALVDAGWSALRRAGHERDVVLIGNLSPRGFSGPPSRSFPNGLPGYFSTTKPLQFARALYCVDSSYRELRGRAAAVLGCPKSSAGSRRFRALHPGLFLATGFGVHPYPYNLPPNQVDSKDPDFAEFGELPRLIRTLDRLHRLYRSSTRPQLYVTEFGYITNPPNDTVHYGTHYLSPRAAATYLNWAEYMSWRNPRIASTMQYLLSDPPPDSSGFATGLLYHDGTAKPTLDAYRMPLYLPAPETRRGRRIEVWGCVRPAHYAAFEANGATQHVWIQFRPRGAKSWRTIRTVPVRNARGYIDVRVSFPATGLVRLAWTDPSAITFFSRAAPVTIR
jgi:hypothetical protein